MLSYPENTVWYIEARPWNGPKDGQAGFAQVDPVSRGSGVVVTFIKVSAIGERKPCSYLLTCAHVVRDKEDRLLEDIVCYPPGSGYVRTGENSRRCGTFPNAEAQPAKVLKLSPCCAVLGSRPDALKHTLASDWVLLEIEDQSFYHQQSVYDYERGQVVKLGSIRLLLKFVGITRSLSLIGFPFGAGTLAERQKAEAEGRGKDYPFWKDGRIVKAAVAKNFRPTSHAEPGMLDYEGPEEARPGMSGGGVFDDKGVLIAIHRSSTDPTMRRGAILSESIVRFLNDKHGMEFASGKFTGKDWRTGLMPLIYGSVALISGSFGAWIAVGSTSPLFPLWIVPVLASVVIGILHRLSEHRQWRSFAALLRHRRNLHCLLLSFAGTALLWTKDKVVLDFGLEDRGVTVKYVRLTYVPAYGEGGVAPEQLQNLNLEKNGGRVVARWFPAEDPREYQFRVYQDPGRTSHYEPINGHSNSGASSRILVEAPTLTLARKFIVINNQGKNNN